MKKTIINVFLIITAIIIYYLQSNFFMWFNIAGVKPNLFVVLALFVGLFSNRTMGIAYGVGIGTIIFMVAAATLIFEVLNYIIHYTIMGNEIEIINFIVILAIEIIYNIILTIILYGLIQKFGYYIENEYKGNKILTKYF